MEGRAIHGEASPAYARRKAVLKNRDVRLSLERVEARILAHPFDMRGRYVTGNGDAIMDTNEPSLLFAYEETDPDTLTWIAWFDLWDRGD